MKKVLGILCGLFLVFAVAGSAGAYTFYDEIDNWPGHGGNVWLGELSGINNPFNYSHDINSQVDFANGHYVTDANLELVFTNMDLLDVVLWGFGDGEEYVRYGFDGEGWIASTPEIDTTNEPFDVVVDTRFLNTDGVLNVELQVWNNAGTGNISLDKSTLSGNAVPEPSTMLLFGTGLLGLAGLGRKKFLKKN